MIVLPALVMPRFLSPYPTAYLTSPYVKLNRHLKLNVLKTKLILSPSSPHLKFHPCSYTSYSVHQQFLTKFMVYPKFDHLSSPLQLPSWSKSPTSLMWITATASWFGLLPQSLLFSLYKKPEEFWYCKSDQVSLVLKTFQWLLSYSEQSQSPYNDVQALPDLGPTPPL